MTPVPFHPAVSAWFHETFQSPTEPQVLGWPIIQKGSHVLIAAPTGSGKTLAAFLCAVNSLVLKSSRGPLPDSTEILYVSPLKALANDVQRNLLDPLEQIRETAARMQLELPEIRPLVRTGDTLAGERRKMLRRPPHILVTTPESLFILLTSQRSRGMLKSVRTVIVDEIHALARDKRGSHLSLSLERLEALTEQPFQRIGLSATQKPIDSIAGFLAGAGRTAEIVDCGHVRELDLAVEVPGDELGAITTTEMWEEIYDRLCGLIQEHRTTLVFVNTRRLSERMAFHLAERLGDDQVTAHHGSLSRELRLGAEEKLKSGRLKAVVATSSLELGIDVGHVDLVCQIGTTRWISLALQRIGRSGHWKGTIPKGRFFATTRDELIECASLVKAIREGLLDKIRIPPAPLDILSQQIVAAAACEEWEEESLYRTVRKAAPYAGLTREEFQSVVAMLAEGISTQRGRRGALLHRDRIHGKIRGRRGARLAAVTSGGAIPDRADFLVKADPGETMVGTLDEDFAVESMQGDIFLLGNMSWRIRRVETGVVRVEDAGGAAPNVPFWRGEAPARSEELSEVLSRVRETILSLEDREARGWLQRECGMDDRGADQAVRYLQAGKTALGALPALGLVVAERFFDEAGGMQLILHSPFGSRINRAWGLALRKRFCRSFNFELQAAATENGVLISLSDQHSFPLESVFAFLSSDSVRAILIQALLDVPLFGTRWRWNASRALAILRFAGGRKVPPPLQRIRSDDLLASVFPEQAACLENIQGDIEVPDHPLVFETLRDCLDEAMDVDGLIRLLEGIETGRIRCAAVDTREPSPFSHEILNANPYAFLDDAPLEERRARAVQTRRVLPEHAGELGTLDAEAIQRVIEEARPRLAGPDEVHDALITLGALTEDELGEAKRFGEELVAMGRASRLLPDPSRTEDVLWFAAERTPLIRRIYSSGRLDPEIRLSENQVWERDRELDRQEAVRELVRCRMECMGPATADELCRLLRLSAAEIQTALAELEGEGQVLAGAFRPECAETEWCNRRLLARIHRLTLGRLRSEIKPVTPAEFMNFLLRWQHLARGTRLHGETGLAVVLEQLQGLEAPASSWETFLLPARIADYKPEFLDRLCLSGQFAWGRLSPAPALGREPSEDSSPLPARSVRPTRVAPVTFFRRSEMPCFFRLRSGASGEAAPEESLNLSHAAAEILTHLERWGASFFEDLTRAGTRLPVELEEGLWELAAAGLVTADGFDNLRFLIHPHRKEGFRKRASRRSRLRAAERSMGRWTLLERSGGEEACRRDSAVEMLADRLLTRWGVVFRDLLARETLNVPWRDLLLVYRRMEARGQIRGGRFVSGFVGEQFALPEALDALRTLRRSRPDGETVRVSAADPLNLTGIVTPGYRKRSSTREFLYFRDGTPVVEDSFLKSGSRESSQPQGSLRVAATASDPSA